MPGKLAGGKVRISNTAPSIISKTKNPATSEVKYFGLVRDQYLDDLTSNLDALEQVLEDIQDPAERKAEGEMNAGDLSIIDGIVNFDIKYEDIETLQGASLSTEEGGTLVNPRFRLSDRISQFATFAGRGTPFVGAGPTKFTYTVPREGDLLPGTVSITTGGVVTGTGTYFSDESTLAADSQLNRTLSAGDFVGLYEADGKTLHRVGATSEAKNADKAIYKVTVVTNNGSITLSPTPAVAVTAGKKLRKRYCNNSLPPFYTESLTSNKFNSSDAYPTSANYTESHRKGYLDGGVFKAEKSFEDWWAEAYNQDFATRSEYGNVTATPDTDPDFNIVKDGNINFIIAKEDLAQGDNFGFRYDFWMKKSFQYTFLKFAAQVNGKLKIDYYKKTSINSNGEAVGAWVTALDTSDPNTFFRQFQSEEPANNRFGVREKFIQGGPNHANIATVDGQSPNNSIVLADTYTGIETGSSYDTFNNNYFPVSVRYWYGQDTVDNSSSNPIAEEDKSVLQFDPSFYIQLVETDLPSANLKYWNDYFGLVKFVYTADALGSGVPGWVVAANGANYETNLSEFAHTFEVMAYQATSGPTAPTSKTISTLLSTTNSFDFILDEVLTGTRYDDGSSPISTSAASIAFPAFSSPTAGDEVYALLINRVISVLPKDTTSKTEYSKGTDSLWQGNIHNPDPLDNYKNVSDLLEGGPNYLEPNPSFKEFDSNTEYFKYKFGIKPEKDTYGPDRYDGFIKNRISELASDYDTDYTHTKLLSIGRQKKDVTIKPLVDPLLDGTAEVRNNGENYTFISVESDEAGNGGEISLVGYPINSMAAIAGSAGQGDGGLILHATDNTGTFTAGSRQGVSTIVNVEFPPTANFDDDGTFSASYSLRNRTTDDTSRKIIYPVSLAAPNSADTFNATTEGMISTGGLGVVAGRTKANKSIFITSYKKNIYTGNNRTSEEERYFFDLLLATRPNAEGTVTVSSSTGTGVGATGNIETTPLFAKNSDTAADCSALYDGALIEFYADSDALADSGSNPAGDNPIVGYVTAYDFANEELSYRIASGPSGFTAPANGSHSVRVYYNFFEVTKWPGKGTDVSGTKQGTSVTASGDAANLQIKGVFSSAYSFSRADSGASLSFSETLYSKAESSPTNPALNPFAPQAELPSPPSAIVTPFDYDNLPSNPSNPGLGGICYPPYQTQDLALVGSVANDTELYNLSTNAVGNHDVYFGSPQVDPGSLGGKFLQVNSEFAFDFLKEERVNIIPTNLSGYTFPTFNEESYTHKLRVLLNPFIGNPTDNNGLFANRGTGNYSGITNENIFNDVLLHSNQKPVKETFFLFINKNGTQAEVLVDNNPSYT